MTRFHITLILVCGVLAIIVSIFRFLRHRRRWKATIVEVVAISGALLLLHGVFDFGKPVMMAGPNKFVFLALAFLAVMLGMLANFGFTYFGKAKGERIFDIGKMVQPLFISPIIFIPLLSLIPETMSSWSFREIIILFTAFQNGFFWSNVVEKTQPRFAK